MSTATPALNPPEQESGARKILWFIFMFFLKFFLALLLLMLASAAGLGTGAYLRLQNLPDVRKLAYYDPAERTEIVTTNGVVLKQMFGEENRKVVRLKDLPKDIPNAIMAIEDARFREHTGVDPVGILRAFRANMESNETVQGGSTITQQVVKNLFLTSERSYARKAAEAVLSVQVDQTFSKDQILELYANLIYLGHNAYGVQGAAETYFGKNAKDLSLGESAMIAGLIRGPEIFSPYRSYEQAKARQTMVLNKMVEYHFITRDQAEQAKKAPLKVNGIRRGMKYPYFTTYVVDYLKHKFSDTELETKGYKIVTTLDTHFQDVAQTMLPKHVAKLLPYNIHQGAMVMVEATTGHVKAMVGGTKFGYGKNEFNRAFQAQRQTGSSFKPYIYATAFENGLTPGSVEVDAPVTYGKWSPQNYGRSYSGSVTIKSALMRSINVVAVKVMDKVGIGKVIEMCKRLGIKSEVRPFLSSALGASEITPLEMAHAYSVFANDGVSHDESPILRIEDKNGKVIFDNSHPKGKRVLDKDVVRALNSCLLAVVTGGTGTAAQVPGHQIAGKTGTTSSHKDAWFMGFTPHYATAVWVGNDDNQQMHGATGGVFCAPLWHDFMTEVLKKEKPRPFPPELPLHRKSQITKGTHTMAAKAPGEEDEVDPSHKAMLARQIRDRLRSTTPVNNVAPSLPVRIRTRTTLPAPVAPTIREERQPVGRMEDNQRSGSRSGRMGGGSANGAPSN
ncbi:MAG: transglycosylase domain-containing protein [Candidatus Sericytochromatia bacterium]